MLRTVESRGYWRLSLCVTSVFGEFFVVRDGGTAMALSAVTQRHILRDQNPKGPL